MGYDARGLRWKASRTRQGRSGGTKGGAARNAPRFHRRFARRSARLGGKPRNRESGEDPTCGAATAAASPAPPPIPRQRNETPRRRTWSLNLFTHPFRHRPASLPRCHMLERPHPLTLPPQNERQCSAWAGSRTLSPFRPPLLLRQHGRSDKKRQGSPREQAAPAAPGVAASRVAFNSRTKQWT